MAKRKHDDSEPGTPVLDFLREIIADGDQIINADTVAAVAAAGDEIEASRVYARHYGQIRNAVGRRMRRLIERRG